MACCLRRAFSGRAAGPGCRKGGEQRSLPGARRGRSPRPGVEQPAARARAARAAAGGDRRRTRHILAPFTQPPACPPLSPTPPDGSLSIQEMVQVFTSQRKAAAGKKRMTRLATILGSILLLMLAANAGLTYAGAGVGAPCRGDRARRQARRRGTAHTCTGAAVRRGAHPPSRARLRRSRLALLAPGGPQWSRSARTPPRTPTA